MPQFGALKLPINAQRYKLKIYMRVLNIIYRMTVGDSEKRTLNAGTCCIPLGGNMATAVRLPGTRAKPSKTAGAFPIGAIPPPRVPGAGTPKGAEPGTATAGTGAEIAATAATAPATAATSRNGISGGGGGGGGQSLCPDMAPGAGIGILVLVA